MRYLSIKEAIEMANKFYNVDPVKLGRDYYRPSLIYNKIHAGVLKNHGHRRMALLSEAEFKKEMLKK